MEKMSRMAAMGDADCLHMDYSPNSDRGILSPGIGRCPLPGDNSTGSLAGECNQLPRISKMETTVASR